MKSLLPLISMSELQRNAKDALAGVQYYAVIQSHGKDKAFVLHPDLGRALLESGALQTLLQTYNHKGPKPEKIVKELQFLLGPVLREFSKE